MNNVYIIGDVHGCYNTLMALIDKLPQDAELIFTGDLIDRGPHSRKVINFVRDNNHICVQGNHEAMMCDAVEQHIDCDRPIQRSNWYANGGNVCFSEYKNSDGSLDFDLFQKDYEFLLNLPILYINTLLHDEENRNLLVTHSNATKVIDQYLLASTKINDDTISEHDMVDYKHQIYNGENIMQWDRNIPTLKQTKFFNVFGHTPMDHFIYKHGEMQVNTNVIVSGVVIDKEIGYANIDSGAVYGANTNNRTIIGKLTALSFPSMEVIQQEYIDDFK